MSAVTSSSISIVDNTNGQSNIAYTFANEFKDDISKQVAEILTLERQAGWSVTDVVKVDDVPKLAIVHFDENSDPAEFGYLRGIVVDLQKKQQILDSFGYTPVAVADALTLRDDKLVVLDASKQAHTFPIQDTEIVRAFEGVMLRAFWYDGRLIMATHRRLNTEKSRWQTSTKTFLEMFAEAHGPSVEQMFDQTHRYSYSCYEFLVVHPQLLIATRQRVDAPYLVFLGEREVTVDYEDIAPGIYKPTLKPSVSGRVSEPCVHQPQSMSVEDANRWLRFGYYDEYPINDPRQMSGEAVILKNKVTDEIIKVHSPSYDFRFTMRGEDPNIAHRFHCLFSLVQQLDIDSKDAEKAAAAFNLFCTRLIPFKPYDPADLTKKVLESDGLVILPMESFSVEYYHLLDNRILVLWINFVYSLPLTQQKKAVGLYKEYLEARRELHDRLMKMHRAHQNPNEIKIHKRIPQIIFNARKLADAKLANHDNVKSNGKFMSRDELVSMALYNYLCTEYGQNFYAIVRDIKKFDANVQREAEKAKQAEAEAAEVKKE